MNRTLVSAVDGALVRIVILVVLLFAGFLCSERLFASTLNLSSQIHGWENAAEPISAGRATAGAFHYIDRNFIVESSTGSVERSVIQFTQNDSGCGEGTCGGDCTCVAKYCVCPYKDGGGILEDKGVTVEPESKRRNGGIEE